ncbi:MAG: hypothetical protein IKC28_00525 [Clostridia bacterium]|nr:hypothetical protein [Clostridia bacterium]
MNEHRCFFIGHRDTPEEIYPLLVAAVEEHISCFGVTEFLVGCRGAFDRMAVRAVLQAKQKHPELSLIELLAYYPGEKKRNLPDGIDGSLYPTGQEFVPKRLSIIRANQYAVEHSAYLIGYAWEPGSNARKLMEYAGRLAEKGKIQVVNLAKVAYPRD